MLPHKYTLHLQRPQCTTPPTVAAGWEPGELTTDTFKQHSAPVTENCVLSTFHVRQIPSCYWWQGRFFFYSPSMEENNLRKLPHDIVTDCLFKLKKSLSKTGLLFWTKPATDLLATYLRTVKVSLSCLSCRSCASRVSPRCYYFYTELFVSRVTR